MSGEFTVAVHALVFLNHMGSFVSSAELAKNVCTNAARIRKVMAKLSRAGFIQTREGAEGGYRFASDPEKLDLASILSALGEKPLPHAWRSGDPHMDCLIASGMSGAMDAIYCRLNAVCENELSDITIADIDARLFARESARPCGPSV